MKRGFTLVELLAVIVLMSLVMMLIFPSIRKIYSSNTNKQYETYKDMMIKYVKTIPDYKSNKYYENRGFLRRTIEKNKFLTKTYFNYYRK